VIGAARVLIVDDDDALLEALPEALRLRLDTVEVDTCDSAAAALERIESHDYDAIVSDIKMPGMDGLALLTQIRQRRPDTPTLLITGHGEEDLAARALEGGAYDYISKPIDRDEFVESLQRAIGTRRFSISVNTETPGRPMPDVTEVRSQTVLVVDDDEAFREIATRIIRDAGYTAAEAASGEEAVEVARREQPDVVVLDVRLRGALSGHEVCRIIKREIQPAPAVLFVSGARTESFDRVGGLLVGADDYVVKPFAADELLARVRALLRRSTAGTPASQLTPREIDVLRLVKEGLSQAEIAQKLDVSPTTARRQIEDVFTKLGV
jgi:DNA-binding response OmpR family regulator